ncbi:MAG: hypothetical protein AAGM33_11840, partial [Pseudomonadota bacterium]
MKDFTPTKETISLHGLGFIQIKLPENRRMHVWHPDLPRRDCFQFSAIHNHRFSFTSTVLKGQHRNQRVDLEIDDQGSHDIISHNGPRASSGGRISRVVGRTNIVPRPCENYSAGQSYETPAFEYHITPNAGIVITLVFSISVM